LKDDLFEIADEIKKKKEEAENLARQCNEAYRAVKTTGLAKEFNARAVALNTSMKWWVCLLLCALAVGAIIGWFRFDKLSQLMSSNNSNQSIVWIELIISALSLGLPMWFAWISTTQIGERFRLSEDYAFKASVAAAYEGYRVEASRFKSDEIDQRLFKSALACMEQEPLRFLKTHASSSPVHELVSKHNAKETLTDAVNKVKDTVKAGVGSKEA
jgi:hypothetical protein